MSKKSDAFYFTNFIQCADLSCTAASLLKKCLTNFDITTISENIDAMHKLEHEGDTKKHELTTQLAKEFVPPIERNDLLKLSQSLDNVTDAIEDILIHIYIPNIKRMRKDIPEFLDLLVKICNLEKNILVEFENFKKSKTLKQNIIEINRLEEAGDALYFAALKNLYATSTDPVEIIAWREIYSYFENAFDTCEDIADIVEAVAIVNT